MSPWAVSTPKMACLVLSLVDEYLYCVYKVFQVLQMKSCPDEANLCIWEVDTL